MPQARRVRFVWSEHARRREQERTKKAIELPDLGSFVRIVHLSPRVTVPDATDQWVYLQSGCMMFGSVFQAPEYDVFLIRTVIEKGPTLKHKGPPQGVALYQLDLIHEQGEEGSEAEQWQGYTYYRRCRDRSPAREGK